MNIDFDSGTADFSGLISQFILFMIPISLQIIFPFS